MIVPLTRVQYELFAETGIRADLTAFAADPVDCDADTLPALPALMTIVDGQVVYTAG